MAKEKFIKWTEQQKRAIFTRGSDVLVTASAGTGKTAVLSGRCVDIVADKSICPDVWSILVLTFTDMAAEQMRSRIAEQLRAAFLQSGNQHLRHQLTLLQGADISTIHSFCKRLITEYFYKLGLDPTFSVIDADEAKLLKAEVLEKTIDWAWQQSNLQQALQQLLYRRDLRTNDGFLAKIIELNDFLDGVLFRQNWYERAAQLAKVVNPFTSDLGEKQKQIIADRLQYIFGQFRHVQKLGESEGINGYWMARFEDNFITPVVRCIEYVQLNDWNQCFEEIRKFHKPPRFRAPENVEEPIAGVIKSAVKRAKNAFKELNNLAVLNPDYLDRISGSVSLQTKVLIELVKKFDQLYSQAKSAFGGFNCLDFADLEHYALKLLIKDDSSEDNLMPSETALALRRKYKYIFVDEYQDINPVQQAILDMISSGANILEVGDVKQSIYAFRGAEPEIFLKQLKRASVDNKNVPNVFRVDLNVNFRSTEGILDFVNKVFSRIMTGSQFAGIDYDESAQLKPAIEFKAEAVKEQKSVVEFHILDEEPRFAGIQSDKNADSQTESESDENLNVVSSRQRQAAMIAQRIKQMVGAETGKPEFQIYDKQKDTFRDVEYRDIVILMRSLAKKANDYVEVLRLASVPVSCQATAGYFETTEITDMLCLMKVLDNPQRDIELAAVLRSPFFGLSDTELAKIKIHSKPVSSEVERTEQQHSGNSRFWNCVFEYSKSGADAKLVDKLKEILVRLEQWRTFSRRGNLADLIWRIYRQTGFLSFVSALPNGQARRANLLKLHDRAIQFEGFVSSAGIPSLTRFVEFIERLQEAGQDWAPAEPSASVGNAVRILSVHKSKGLEFPIVFLAELDSKFNKKDIYADILADASDTLGLQIIDRKSNSKLRSLAHEVIAEQKLSKSLAEEMRILYVATTRARDRLILTASQKRKSCRDIICNGLFFGNERINRGERRGRREEIENLKFKIKKNNSADSANSAVKEISDWQLHACQSPLEWILYALSEQKALHEAFETDLVEKTCDDGLFSLKLYSHAELQRLCEFVIKLKKNKLSRTHSDARMKGEGRGLLSQVKKSLAWRYTFGDAPLLPAKQSVTQLTHLNDEYVKFDYSRALERQPAALMAAKNGRVAASSAAWGWIGTATHLVISQLDLSKPVNKEAVKKIKEKLLADGAINEAVAETIDTDSILSFFQSELGRMVLNAENTIWREWPFTFALPAYSSCVVRDAYCAKVNTQYNISNTQSCPRAERRDAIAYSAEAAAKAGRDTIIVQGIIDMLIQTPQDLVVIDFKTDNITAKQVPERAELYRQQLELYSRAASAILKDKLLGKWLYFLTPATEFEIK